MSYDVEFETEICEWIYGRVGACVDHWDNVNTCDLIAIRLPSGAWQHLDEPLVVEDDAICQLAIEVYQSGVLENRATDKYEDQMAWRNSLEARE